MFSILKVSPEHALVPFFTKGNGHSFLEVLLALLFHRFHFRSHSHSVYLDMICYLQITSQVSISLPLMLFLLIFFVACQK
jgi:hypothetical protein